MRKILTFVLTVLILAMSLQLASATSGAIWTTTASCGDPQNENHYDIGETVYLAVNGSKFNSGSYYWEIIGKPGKASCDPDAAVANGYVFIAGAEKLCFPLYNVSADDCGEYSLKLDGKNDNYRVNEAPVVPEFGFLLAGLTIFASLGIFFLIRRK